MSLWTIPWLCKYSRPSKSWQKYLQREINQDDNQYLRIFYYYSFKSLYHTWWFILGGVFCSDHTLTQSTASYFTVETPLLGLGPKLGHGAKAADKFKLKIADGGSNRKRVERGNERGRGQRGRRRERTALPVSLKYWKSFLWDAVQHFLHPTNAILHHHIRKSGVKGDLHWIIWINERELLANNKKSHKKLHYQQKSLKKTLNLHFCQKNVYIRKWIYFLLLLIVQDVHQLNHIFVLESS